MSKQVGDSLAYASEKASIVSDLVSTKRQYIFKQIINGFLLFIILFIFGCFDFAHLKFHYEYLIDANYWVNIATKGIADLCAYNLGINIVVDDVIRRNRLLARLKYIYEKLNKCKEHDFEHFIILYNRECKVLAYKHKMNHEVYKLNRHSKKADRIYYAEHPDSRDRKYCVKRAELEYLRSDEYIQKNIDTLDVKYRDVDPAVFDLEINGSQKVVQNNVTGSLQKGKIIGSATAMTGILGLSIFFNSFSLEPNKQEFVDEVTQAINYATRILTDIAIVAWQLLRGILGTHNIVSKQLSMPLEERVKILKKYYKWRLENGQTAPKCYFDSYNENVEFDLDEKPDQGEKSVEIELSKEDYEELIRNKK